MKQLFKNRLSLALIMLIVLMNLCRNFLWLVPSSLMSPMMAELGMNYTQAGLLVTIVTVVMGVFLVGGSYLLNYIRPLFSMVLGLGVLAVGGIGSCLSQNYGAPEKLPSPMAKGMAWLKTNTRMAIRGDDTTAAYLVADGCDMGVKSLSRSRNRYSMASQDAIELAQELIRCEEQLSAGLRPYL